MNNNLVEKRNKSKFIFDGQLLKVYKDDVTLPNGKVSMREYIKHIGAVGIIPMTDDNEVIIETQFRYPLNKTILEIPAGKLDYVNEDRLSAAKRELKEETGIVAKEWINLGDIAPVAAYSNEIITLYLAKNLEYGDRNLDEDEFINISKINIDELIQDVMNGKIIDSKTQIAILKVARYLHI